MKPKGPAAVPQSDRKTTCRVFKGCLFLEQEGAELLDAFIIERIRRDRERARRDERLPLRHDRPMPTEREREKPAEERDRGGFEIDFHL